MKVCILLVCFAAISSAAVLSSSQSSYHTCSAGVQSLGVGYGVSGPPCDLRDITSEFGSARASSYSNLTQNGAAVYVEGGEYTSAQWEVYFPNGYDNPGWGSTNFADATHAAQWVLTTPGRVRDGFMRVSVSLSSFRNELSSMNLGFEGPGFQAGCDNYHPNFPFFGEGGCYAPGIDPEWTGPSGSSEFIFPVTLGVPLGFGFSATASSGSSVELLWGAEGTANFSANILFLEADGVTRADVPEPGTISLLLSGLGGLALKLRRRSV